MKSFRLFVLLFIPLLPLLQAGCRLAPLADSAGLHTGEDPPDAAAYIQSGRRGSAQARIFRIALTKKGRAQLRESLRELEYLDLPAIAAGESKTPFASRRARMSHALGLARELIAIEPHSPGAAEYLGYLHYRLGAKDAARSAFARAARLNPGDAYLARALERWQVWLRENKPLYYDAFVRQMYPGYELHFMEHRLKPRAEGVYENHHVYFAGARFGATPARNQFFELLNSSEVEPEAIVIGSSRVREGLRPVWVRREIQKSAGGGRRVGGVLNLSYGGASTRFFLGALRYLEEFTKRRGRPLPIVALGIDLEMLSFQGIAFLNPEFKRPITLSRPVWEKFRAGGGALEVWPFWRFASRPKAWRATSWSVLRNRPRRYAFPAQPLNYRVNPEMRAQIEEILPLLKRVGERVVLIENPVPTFYDKKWSANSSRPIMRELARKYDIPFVTRDLAGWGLNDGHFYGSVIQDPDKLDYLHLNYPGSHIWSRAVGELLAKEL